MAAVMGAWIVGTSAVAQAQTKFDLYGFVMTDIGFNDIGVDPDWFDVQRPTKLPSFEDEFGDEGSAFFGVRQTRFGIKTTTPTEMGDLKTQFEWELFGTGVDAGQTTLRLRHAYGELGHFGAGQTWSPFMDIDVFPNTIEYWGPNGMAFFRNVQFRWMPVQGESRVTIALERPGASGDQGSYADKIDFGGITPRFPLPDLSAEARKAFSKGYIEVAGIVRKIEWEDLSGGPLDLSGDVTGWGVNVSSNFKFRPEDVLRLSYLYGEGVENYMNDAPADVGPEPNPGNPLTPIKGVALPVTGVVAFLDHNWNSQWSTSVGYSMVEIDNSEGQSPDAFKKGQYMLANLLWAPISPVMMGVEGGWIHRENNSDGFDVDQYHVQFSFKYSFATTLGE
jgi:hypothetical protein